MIRIFVIILITSSCSGKKSKEEKIQDLIDTITPTEYFVVESFEIEKNAYKALGQKVLNEKFQPQFNNFIDTMKDYSMDSNNYQTNLNYILDFIEINKIPFLIRMNEDNGAFNSITEATDFMKLNFNIDVDLFSAGEKYESNDFECTVETDRLLRKYGYQYGFIDTGSDENIILFHKSSDENKIEKLVNKTGYTYWIADE